MKKPSPIKSSSVAKVAQSVSDEHSPVVENIEDLGMQKALEHRYLAYALSTITARSLPDVRDGLKPVHRRIMWAMRELNLPPSQAPKKSARVVGDVIGKFHPHGDVSVYEAMVRMAQPFSLRYPLVDGQGNFGNVDGDSAAAMRYTEARLTRLAQVLMDGIDQGAVDFKTNYDGTEREPDIMPSGFPNLLANGTTGIAVGMATSIPPHNLGELCDAMLFLLKERTKKGGWNRDLTEQLMKYVRGPDFPTGGVLVESPESILESYRTGRGSFKLRSYWEKEEKDKGHWVVVITEIPYTIKKSDLIEKMAEAWEAKKFPEIENIQDQSDHRVRIIITPVSRTTNAEAMMERLFRSTQLQINFPLNLNVLDTPTDISIKGHTRAPRVVGLQGALTAFLDHRRDVLLRRSRRRLEVIARRLEILAGLSIVFANLDAVLKIIRSSDNPKVDLMKKFSLSDLQAEFILETRLRALSRIEQIQIDNENKMLKEEQSTLQAILESETLQDKKIGEQIQSIINEFKNTVEWPRLTRIEQAPVINLDEYQEVIKGEPITVICSRAGWVRAVRGHTTLTDNITFRDGDSLAFLVPMQSNDRVIVLMSDGRAYTLPASQISTTRGFGDPLRVKMNIPPNTDIVSLFAYNPDQLYLISSSDGYGFLIRGGSLVSSKKGGRMIMPCNPGASVRNLTPISTNQTMVALTSDTNQRSRMLCFPIKEIPEMERARGVVLYRGGFVDAVLFAEDEPPKWTDNGGRIRVLDWKNWLGHRAQAGLLPPKGFPRTLKFQ